MENATCGKRNFNDITSLLHGRLPEYPIFQKILEIGLKLAHAQTGVFPPPGYEAMGPTQLRVTLRSAVVTNVHC